MTKEEYDRDYPELDWEELFSACVFAISNFHMALLKEADDAPASALEHRAMAYRRLRDAMQVRKEGEPPGK